MYEYRATVVKVYDGDTLTVDIDLGFGVFLKKQKVRLRGIDTPEIRGAERKMGLIARDRVRELVLNRAVLIQTHKDKKGKYGRWVADVYINTTSLSEILLNEGLATSYA